MLAQCHAIDCIQMNTPGEDPLNLAGEGGRDPRGVPSPDPGVVGTYDAFPVRGVIAASYFVCNSPRVMGGTICEINLTFQ